MKKKNLNDKHNKFVEIEREKEGERERKGRGRKSERKRERREKKRHVFIGVTREFYRDVLGVR